MPKYKVIEGEQTEFEKELNEFAAREDITIIMVQYSTSTMAPEEKAGWLPTNFHCALVMYRELVFDDID